MSDERRPAFEIPRDGVADANDRGESGGADTPRAEPRRGGPEDPVVPPRQESTADRPGVCVVLGPSGVGKTSLLMATERACALPEPGEPDLIFLPEPGTAQLMQRAVQAMVYPEVHIEATRADAEYRFHIRAEEGHGSRRLVFHQPLEMVIRDGPGGALFPGAGHPFLPDERRRWEETMTATARRAESIIFCVSAVEPRSDRWEEYLSVLLTKMAMPVPEEAGLQTRVKAWRRRRTPVVPGFRKALNAKRILLLITKVDQLCGRAITMLSHAAGLREESSSVLTDVAALQPMQLAARLDPVQQARQLLGPKILNQIRYALRPGAVFAVGACSAGGFNPSTGEPYWMPNGKPRRLSAETEAEVLRSWVPFGVRDALFFAATGRTRGMVRRIERRHLLHNTGIEPVEIARNDMR